MAYFAEINLSIYCMPQALYILRALSMKLSNHLHTDLCPKLLVSDTLQPLAIHWSCQCYTPWEGGQSCHPASPVCHIAKEELGTRSLTCHRSPQKPVYHNLQSSSSNSLSMHLARLNKGNSKMGYVHLLVF